MLYSPGCAALTWVRNSSVSPNSPSTTLMPVFSVNGGKAKLWNASETMPPQPSNRTCSTAASASRVSLPNGPPTTPTAAAATVSSRIMSRRLTSPLPYASSRRSYFLSLPNFMVLYLPSFARTVRASLPAAAETADHISADQRQQDRQDDHHRAQRVDLRRDRGAQHGEDLGRHRLDAGLFPEQGRGDVVERNRDREQKPAQDGGRDQRQRHLAEGLQAVGAEAERRLLEILPEAHQPRLHHQHHERQRQHGVTEQQHAEAAIDPDQLQEHQQRNAQHHLRDQQRHGDEGADRVLAPELVAHQRDRGHHAEEGGKQRAADRQDDGGLKRLQDRIVGEQLVVPLQADALHREGAAARGVEGQQHHHRDRRELEDVDADREQAEQPQGRPRFERRIHRAKLR